MKEDTGGGEEDVDVKKEGVGDVAPQIEKRDVLADLGELQREVDALRGKFGSPGTVDLGPSDVGDLGSEGKKGKEDASEHG